MGFVLFIGFWFILFFNKVCSFLDFVLKCTAREHNRNVYNLKKQSLYTNHKKNVNHHYLLPVELLFTDLNNYFPISKSTVNALAKSHFNDQPIHYKRVIICKYINSLIIHFPVAADAEGVEKVAVTCPVVYKIRFLFNDLQ